MSKPRDLYLYIFTPFFLIITFLLAACTQAAMTELPSPTTNAGQQTTIQPTVALAEQKPALPTQTATVENKILVQSTATNIPPAANRLKPEDWQNWPIVPVVSGRARQIYQSGLELGTNPASFSKVGDCQAIKDVLLGRYDKSGSYTLRENASNLEETIQFFKGSFDRDGEAVQGGFNAASELTPLMSNPDVCEPGETPLECEVRVHNPSIMLISLEVWWNGRSPEVYEKNMRQIIEYSISKGILPILSTKADNVEGDHSINLATARLAYEYDLPLWNWWKAAQALPNRGLDPNRPDGFHISQEFAWPERSFTALQALDAVWRGVRSTTPAATVTPAQTTAAGQTTFDLLQPSVTSVAAAAGTPQSEPEACPMKPSGENSCLATSTAISQNNNIEPIVNPGGKVELEAIDPKMLSNPEGFILLSAARRSGEVVTPLGIYLIDPASSITRQITPGGTELQAVSPDGRQFLFSQGSDLFLAGTDGVQPVLLTNRFFDRDSVAAAWMPDGKSVAFLAEQDGASLLVLYPLDGSAGWKRLSPAGVQPIALFPSMENGRIFWENGTCSASGACTGSGVYVSGLDGSSVEFLPGAVKVDLSADHQWLAVENQTKNEKSQISLATMDLKTTRPLENIGDHLLDFSWSPDGARLSLLTLERSDYSGQWLDVRNLVITPLDMGTKILPATSGMNPRAVWSPDSQSILLTGTQQVEGAYAIQLRIMDAATGAVRELSAQSGFTDREFIYTTRIKWVKALP